MNTYVIKGTNGKLQEVMKILSSRVRVNPKSKQLIVTLNETVTIGQRIFDRRFVHAVYTNLIAYELGDNVELMVFDKFNELKENLDQIKFEDYDTTCFYVNCVAPSQLYTISKHVLEINSLGTVYITSQYRSLTSDVLIHPINLESLQSEVAKDKEETEKLIEESKSMVEEWNEFLEDIVNTRYPKVSRSKFNLDLLSLWNIISFILIIMLVIGYLSTLS